MGTTSSQPTPVEGEVEDSDDDEEPLSVAATDDPPGGSANNLSDDEQESNGESEDEDSVLVQVGVDYEDDDDGSLVLAGIDNAEDSSSSTTNSDSDLLDWEDSSETESLGAIDDPPDYDNEEEEDEPVHLGVNFPNADPNPVVVAAPAPVVLPAPVPAPVLPSTAPASAPAPAPVLPAPAPTPQPAAAQVQPPMPAVVVPPIPAPAPLPVPAPIAVPPLPAGALPMPASIPPHIPIVYLPVPTSFMIVVPIHVYVSITGPPLLVRRATYGGQGAWDQDQDEGIASAIASAAAPSHRVVDFGPSSAPRGPGPRSHEREPEWDCHCEWREHVDPEREANIPLRWRPFCGGLCSVADCDRDGGDEGIAEDVIVACEDISGPCIATRKKRQRRRTADTYRAWRTAARIDRWWTRVRARVKRWTWTRTFMKACPSCSSQTGCRTMSGRSRRVGIAGICNAGGSGRCFNAGCPRPGGCADRSSIVSLPSFVATPAVVAEEAH